MKVSVIVPVYNPGSYIDRCIRSLLDQSLPRDEYEAIFVDDGSTDGTPARLDALAAEHAQVRVEHIPNSGWPGKPRNVGLEMARGEFVYFVDNDDYLAPEALERLYDRALRADADVVIGKVVGRGKFVPRSLFLENLDGVSVEWPPLVRLLTPHKLFRRSFLDEHGIRFPEGRRRLEDHMFTMAAYFNARSISVLADYPCYFWVLGESTEDNASYQVFDAKQYYENMREVLDLVVAHTEPGPLRDQLLSHWYRGKMLGRVGGEWFPKRPPEFQRALYDEVSAVARERYGPEVEEWLPWSLRVRSYLLRESTFAALSTLADFEAGLRADVTVGHGHWREDGTFAIPFRARLVGLKRQPMLLFERRGHRLLWVPPEALRDEIPDHVRDVTDVFEQATAELQTTAELLIRAPDSTVFTLPGRSDLELLPAAGGLVTPVIGGEALVEPGKAAVGAKPAPGWWSVRGAVTVYGFTATGPARRRGFRADLEIEIDDGGRVSSRRWKSASAMKGTIARRLPRLAQAARRARRPGRAATR